MEEDNQTITTPQLGQGQPTTFRQYIKSLHNNKFRKDKLKQIFSQGPIITDPRTNEAYTNPLNLLGDTMDTINDQVRLGGYSLKDLGYDAMDFVEEKTTEHIDTGYPALDKVIVGGAVIGTALVTPDATDLFLPGGADLLKLAKRPDIFKSANKLVNQAVNTNWIGKLNKLTEPKLAVAGGGNINAASIFNSVDTTGMFKSQSATEQIIKDYKKASGGFGIDKLEKSIKTSITKHQLPTNLKAYKKINVRKYNKYINDELKHWAEHGKGSGKYFNIEHSTNPNLNINYRLDQKSNPGKILDSSGNIIDRSFSVTNLLNKKIQNLSQADRLILLQNTTLDKATVSKVAKLTPGGKILHHAAPVQSTSKIQEAFFKANPNLTMDDWIPIQRKVEKEFNFAFGDSPLNARYPETIAQHEKYHGFLREEGLYPNQLKFPDGLSPDAAYKQLKNLAKKVLEIDKKVGVRPEFTKKTIGKQFANRSQ